MVLSSCGKRGDVVLAELYGCKDMVACDSGLLLLCQNSCDVKAQYGVMFCNVDGEECLMQQMVSLGSEFSNPHSIELFRNWVYVACDSVVVGYDIDDMAAEPVVVALADADSVVSDIHLIDNMLLLSSQSGNRLLAMELEADGAPSHKGFEVYCPIPQIKNLLYADDRLYLAACDTVFAVDDFAEPVAHPLFVRDAGGSCGVSMARSGEWLYISDVSAGKLSRFGIADFSVVETIELSDEIGSVAPVSVVVFNSGLYIADINNNRLLRVVL